MSLTPLALPYNNFKLGEIIDPDEFNANNSAIVGKINTMVNVITTGNTDPGGDGEDIFLPSYIKETYIDPVEIKSPLITGNTLLGSNGMVGMTSIGTLNSSVRIWAGSTNKDTAPFKVTHGGEVTMTKANIETQADEKGSYIKMSGSKIEGGQSTKDPYYTIGTAALNTGSNSGIFWSNTYLSDSNPDGSPDYTMQVVHNSIMTTGGNFVIGTGGKGVVISPSVKTNSHSKSIPGGAILNVEGSINLTGDIYVNGVKMKLTPA